MRVLLRVLSGSGDREIPADIQVRLAGPSPPAGWCGPGALQSWSRGPGPAGGTCARLRRRASGPGPVRLLLPRLPTVYEPWRPQALGREPHAWNAASYLSSLCSTSLFLTRGQPKGWAGSLPASPSAAALLVTASLLAARLPPGLLGHHRPGLFPLWFHLSHHPGDGAALGSQGYIHVVTVSVGIPGAPTAPPAGGPQFSPGRPSGWELQGRAMAAESPLLGGTGLRLSLGLSQMPSPLLPLPITMLSHTYSRVALRVAPP